MAECGVEKIETLKLNVVYREWRAHFLTEDGKPKTAILMAESESAARICAEQLAKLDGLIFVSVEPC